MLQALHATLEAGHNAHLTMLGWSDRTEPIWHQAHAFIAEHRLHDSVTIKNNVAFADMPGVYREHDLFVLPSIDEPFSITPLEAMSFGVPAVITNQNGAQHCLTNKKDGAILPSNDLAVLTNILCRLAEERKLLEELSSNAISTINNEHSKATFLNQFYNTLNKN
jgi:glycosyltransferase involved in cell wall biosynthesis